MNIKYIIKYNLMNDNYSIQFDNKNIILPFNNEFDDECDAKSLADRYVDFLLEQGTQSVLEKALSECSEKNEYIKVDQIAKIFRIGKSTAYEIVKSNNLNSVQGKKGMVKITSLVKIIKESNNIA